MLSEMPPMPMNAGEIYHVVSMEGWEMWKKYTDFKSAIKGRTPGEEDVSMDSANHIEKDG